MTVNDFEKLINKYEKQALKTGKQIPISESVQKEISESINNIPPKYSEAFRLAMQNNYSQFDSLPLLLKTYLGAKRLTELREEFKNNLSLENEAVKNYLREHTMDVALRAGISVEKNSADESTRNNAKALDTFMNTCIMQSTMMPPVETQKEQLITSIGAEAANVALQQDLKRQRVLAKTYFMAQLGKYDVLDDNGISRRFNVPLSETLAHGSRTNFILPAGNDTRQVIDAYMGTNNGNDSVIEERTAATHHVKRRAVGKNGLIKSETKESRTYSPLKIFGHQYGMDLSVGGIGRMGPNARVISGNGESGHAYMRIEEGDAKHCASLLIGIEGSAPGKESALGHSHNASGLSGNQSAFFSDKQIVGSKNGGRQVDLSGLESNDLAALLREFDQKYSDLQESANTPQGREKLAELNNQLMGEHMSASDLVTICERLGIGGENVRRTISHARCGYMAKLDFSEMDGNAFRQSVRATMSQKVACDLAEKRFKSSEYLYLAVGAVKELICTHETRSLGWRLRHPIMNYREKATIKDLTKRLRTEKGFAPIDIANTMGAPYDTFSLNWGEGLTNDYDTRRFLKQRDGHFTGKSTEGPVVKATKKFMGKLYKMASSTEQLQERMKIEQQLMQEELYNSDMDMDDYDLDEIDDDELEEATEQDLEETRDDAVENRQRLFLEGSEVFEFDTKDARAPRVSTSPQNEKNHEKSRDFGAKNK